MKTKQKFPKQGQFRGGITRPKSIPLKTEPLCVCCGKLVKKEMKLIEPKREEYVTLAELMEILTGSDVDITTSIWLLIATAKVGKERNG